MKIFVRLQNPSDVRHDKLKIGTQISMKLNFSKSLRHRSENGCHVNKVTALQT